MKKKFIAVYRLSGVIGLPSSADVELLSKGYDGSRAFLTLNGDEYYQHFRRLAAIGTLTASIFMPANDLTSATTPSDRFARAMELVTISENERDRVLLIVEVEGHLDEICRDHIIDYGECLQQIDLFDHSSLAEIADKTLRIAFAGLTLALQDQTTDTMQMLGSIVYAIDPIDDRTIYSTNITISGSMICQSHLSAEDSATAVAMASAIRASSGLENVVRLISVSSTQQNNLLMSFLSAWTALELFVQDVFKTTYEPQIHAIFNAAAPVSASVFVDRMRSVMKDKYNIRDKFVAVSSALNPDGADVDIARFKKLKEHRDGLAHAMKGDLSDLPASETRTLLRKYLKLHLTGSIEAVKAAPQARLPCP